MQLWDISSNLAKINSASIYVLLVLLPKYFDINVINRISVQSTNNEWSMKEMDSENTDSKLATKIILSL